MRHSKPIRLTDLDIERTAERVTHLVYERTLRDINRLGMAFAVPQGMDPKTPLETVLARSRVAKAARVCVEWAVAGKGTPEDAAAALRDLRADLDGLKPGDISGRAPDLSTMFGVLVVAVIARLALVEGRTVEVEEVATLASIDPRSIRAAAMAGTLPPLEPGRRPMRFAADVVCQYLYTRGVPGFVGTPTAPSRGSDEAHPPA